MFVRVSERWSTMGNMLEIGVLKRKVIFMKRRMEVKERERGGGWNKMGKAKSRVLRVLKLLKGSFLYCIRSATSCIDPRLLLSQ